MIPPPPSSTLFPYTTLFRSDVEGAANLIWAVAADYASAGRDATLGLWADRFTPLQTEASPALCLVRATCAMATGNGAEVAHWTSLTLRLVEETSPPEGERLAVAARVLRAAGAARDGVVPMRADAVAAFDLLPPENPWASLCRLLE